MQRTLVTCVAEPKSGSQEVGTCSNSNLMESQMFRREGEMDSHFGNVFGVILLNSSFALFLLRIMGTSSSFFFCIFFKEDNLMSLNSAFSEGTIAGIFYPFWKWIGTQWRFWAELWWNCLVEVDDNTRSR